MSKENQEPPEKRFSSKVRKSIQEAFERKKEQAQQESWKKRLIIARHGMEFYEAKKFAEALRAFRDYVKILETRYGCGEGGLKQSLFDSQQEKNEILLLAGIYWDTAKIYDHMPGMETEMRLALSKYLEFSVNTPHLILASEALRRYMGSNKCAHKDDFTKTHNLLRSHLANCFIASAVFDPTSAEVETLRAFRDRKLLKSAPGRFFVAAYYQISPPIAIALTRAPVAAAATRLVLRCLIRAVQRLP